MQEVKSGQRRPEAAARPKRPRATYVREVKCEHRRPEAAGATDTTKRHEPKGDGGDSNRAGHGNDTEDGTTRAGSRGPIVPCLRREQELGEAGLHDDRQRLVRRPQERRRSDAASSDGRPKASTTNGTSDAPG